MLSLNRSAVSAARAFSTSARRADLARITLIGRLVADPEVKSTVNGKEFAAYTVATTDRSISRDDGE